MSNHPHVVSAFPVQDHAGKEQGPGWKQVRGSPEEEEDKKLPSQAQGRTIVIPTIANVDDLIIPWSMASQVGIELFPCTRVT